MSQVPRELHPGRPARDLFGAELRHWRCARELSQAALAERIHFSADLIGRVEKAERWPQRDLTDACDTALDTGGVLGRIWPWVDTERRYALDHADHADADADIEPARAGFGIQNVDRAGSSRFAGTFLPHTGCGTRADGRARGRGRGGRRRPAPPARSVLSCGGPPSLEELLAMAAHESAHYADHPSTVGPATLHQLRTDTIRLARSFANAPRLEVFTRARWLRDRAFALLDGGRQRRTEFRDLHFLAGATCGMLAEITENFGFRAEAMAHARTAWLCAEQADHNGLRAWILGEQALIAYWDGRPTDAMHYAQRGQRFTTAGSAAVWLLALEARAGGRLGAGETVRAALTRAGEARENVIPDGCDELGGIMAFTAPKQHHYSADAYLGISESAAVITEAEACVTGYQAGPDSERAYDTQASAQLNAAMAHVIAGDLDAARAAAQPAFGLDPELRIDALSQRFRRLHRHLTAPGMADAPMAVELRDQIEYFLAIPSQAGPPTL